MLLRRPHLLLIEPRACAEVDLLRLVSAAPDESARVRWVALAPHLGRECGIEAEDLAVFGGVAPGEVVERETLERRFGVACVARLVGQGLLIGDHADHAELVRRDRRLGDGAWWGLAAFAQVFGRWDGVDVAVTEALEGRRTPGRMIEEGGLPPPEAFAVGAPEARIGLPAPAKGPLDALLASRVTCRNFDPAASVRPEHLATMLHRVFGAQGSREVAPGATMLKKHSPSGGGLHPVEAFVLVQRAEGLEPGLYHYHCLAHALEPIRALSVGEAAAAARELVAGQAWFADAPVIVLLAARFRRSYWKYREHAKAWKVVQLDAGHLSQTLYLSATELGLGAFVTAAINDACAERLFALDGIDVGPVAACGFGIRAALRSTREFDPAREGSDARGQ
jgi:putative peptide maturation dehydrogenase